MAVLPSQDWTLLNLLEKTQPHISQLGKPRQRGPIVQDETLGYEVSPWSLLTVMDGLGYRVEPDEHRATGCS